MVISVYSVTKNKFMFEAPKNLVNPGVWIENRADSATLDKIRNLVDELREHVNSILPLKINPVHNHERRNFNAENDIVDNLRKKIYEQIGIDSGIGVMRYHDLEDHFGRKGLGVLSSIHCMDDFVRTAKFIDGLYAGIEELELSMEGEIEMVDAGCGGIPVYGLLAALKSERVRVTCLEIDPATAMMAWDIICAFRLQNRVDVFETDATEYWHKKTIDLFITETMFSGFLADEKMPKIYSHFSDQVSEKGVMVPEEVKVKLGLVSIPEYERSNARVDHVDITARNVNLPVVTGLNKMNRVDRVEAEYSLDDLEDGYYRIMASSEVCLNSAVGISLKHMESIITTPTLVTDEPVLIDRYARRKFKKLLIGYRAAYKTKGEKVFEFV